MRTNFFAVAVVCLAACGGGGSSADGGTGGGSAAAGGGAATGGGSATGGGTATGGGSATGGGTASGKQGEISLTQSCTGAFCSGVGVAYFITLATSGQNPCTQNTVAGCEVLDCPLDAGSFTVTPTMHGAGVIAVAGTLADGGISLQPKDGGYGAAVVLQRLWNGGETLTVSAAGDEVPAFSGKTVTAPNELTVTAPTCAASSCGSASKSAPLTISWSGGAGTSVTASLTGTGGGRFVSASCPLTSSPGTIASAVLTLLPASTDGGTRLSVDAANRTRFTAGEWDVTFSAYGSSTSGALNLQ